MFCRPSIGNVDAGTNWAALADARRAQAHLRFARAARAPGTRARCRCAPKRPRMAQARDRMPASFAARILHSSIRGYARVLDRHAKGDYDMDVHDIGRVRGITVLFRGPNPGHEVMERMLIYVAVRPEHYDAVRATHGFSFHMDRE